MAKYLDRDDVLNVIDYIRTKYISVYNRRDKCSQFWADTIRYFEKRINNLNNYDVEPVRHGHWLKTDAYPHRVYCSECHTTYVTNEEIIQGRGWQAVYCTEAEFCPHCGAKMDGKENNDNENQS